VLLFVVANWRPVYQHEPLEGLLVVAGVGILVGCGC